MAISISRNPSENGRHDIETRHHQPDSDVAGLLHTRGTGNLDSHDKDLGSGGVLLLPDQPGSFPHILVEAGKEGRIYVVNRDQMTTNNSHYCSGCPNDPEIIEESGLLAVGLAGMACLTVLRIGTILSTSGVSGDVLKSIPITSGLPDFTHVTRSSLKSAFLVLACRSPRMGRQQGARSSGRSTVASMVHPGQDRGQQCSTPSMRRTFPQCSIAVPKTPRAMRQGML